VADEDKYNMGRLEADIAWIKKTLSNHLEHHSRYLYWVVGALGTIGIGLILNAIL
jgi:hypothetical protein